MAFQAMRGQHCTDILLKKHRSFPEFFCVICGNYCFGSAIILRLIRLRDLDRQARCREKHRRHHTENRKSWFWTLQAIVHGSHQHFCGGKFMAGRRDRRQVHSSASRESPSIQDPVVIPDRTNPTFNVNDDNAAKKIVHERDWKHDFDLNMTSMAESHRIDNHHQLTA